jgi:hypothetical protein
LYFGKVGLVPIRFGHLPSEFLLSIGTLQASRIIREVWKAKVLIQRHVSIVSSYDIVRAFFMQIITIPTAVRDALIEGDLSTADMLLTQEISTDTNNHDSYANRSLVMARKHNWDQALDDAVKVNRSTYHFFLMKG